MRSVTSRTGARPVAAISVLAWAPDRPTNRIWQSRACAAVARGTYIFALPGSNGAVKDGWDRILAEQLDSRNRPCNFVELMPRLREK